MTPGCLQMDGCKCSMQGDDLSIVTLDQPVDALSGLVFPDMITHKLDRETLIWLAAIVGGAVLLWRSKK